MNGNVISAEYISISATHSRRIHRKRQKYEDGSTRISQPHIGTEEVEQIKVVMLAIKVSVDMENAGGYGANMTRQQNMYGRSDMNMNRSRCGYVGKGGNMQINH